MLHSIVKAKRSQIFLVQDDRERRKGVVLQWKDYLAITIASLQTVLLPIILLLIVILVFAILFGMFLVH